MMNNQYFQNNGGFAYAGARPTPGNNQPLTQEQANQLRQDGTALDMKIDQFDLWRAICTHKDPATGASTLSQNGDGTFTCSICGTTFNMFNGEPADVEAAVKTLSDMMETAKAIHFDAPQGVIEKYYQCKALLAKFPHIWKHACQNLDRYMMAGNNPLAPIGSQYSGFNALNNLLTNPYAMYQQQPMMGQQPAAYGYPQQPMMAPQMMGAPVMGYPQQQPMMAPQGYPQQPMMAPAVGMDPNATNPMAYGAPVAPVAAPTVGAAPAAPAPAASGEVTQQKTFNV